MKLPVKDASPFIPYGFMNPGFLDSVPPSPAAPEDWLPGVPYREQKFEQWFDTTLKDIADAVWPLYDPGAEEWEGAAADLNRMTALTKADLDLIVSIRARKLLDKRPETAVLSLDCPTHREWFNEEDKPHAFASQHEKYDTRSSDALRRLMRAVYFRDHCAKESNWVGTRFKAMLQRPRPYQMALALGGYPKFSYEHAASADSPSASSGHALQGLLAVGGIIETLELKAVKLDQKSWDAIEQYGVDVGDRRVLAGVHYPSDNIVSWITAMSIADHIYRSSQVKCRLWHAITTRSIVYREIQSYSGVEAYRQALDLLERHRPPGC